MTRANEADWLCSFFPRLAELEPVLRILLSDARLSASFIFRGAAPRQILLDLASHPVVIREELSAPSGRVRIAAEAQVMHRVLLGELAGGEAFGRRELLFRGSAADLARFIPLLDFAPLLYREHLADQGVPGFARPRAAGAARRNDSDRPSQEVSMSHPDSNPRLPAWGRLRLGSEQALVRSVNRLAYAAGYGVGLLRHRYLQSLSLFDVLGELSRGVADAGVGPRAATAEPGLREEGT